MSGVPKRPKPLGLVKHADDDSEQTPDAPDVGVQEAIGRYAQRTSSQKAGAVQEAGKAGTSFLTPAGNLANQAPSVIEQLRRQGEQQGPDSGGETDEDDEEAKYEMMSRGTLKARSQALVEVIQASRKPQ